MRLRSPPERSTFSGPLQEPARRSRWSSAFRSKASGGRRAAGHRPVRPVSASAPPPPDEPRAPRWAAGGPGKPAGAGPLPGRAADQLVDPVRPDAAPRHLGARATHEARGPGCSSPNRSGPIDHVDLGGASVDASGSPPRRTALAAGFGAVSIARVVGHGSSTVTSSPDRPRARIPGPACRRQGAGLAGREVEGTRRAGRWTRTRRPTGRPPDKE